MLLAATALALGAAAPTSAGGLSYTQIPPRGGLAMPGSPYRYETVTVGARHRLTVVEQIRRRGGRLGRRWVLPGAWHLSAPAYDREATGLAADAPVLVVTRYGAPRHSALRRHTELALLYTGRYRPHGPRPIRRVTLPGDYTVQAVSPDGEFIYLAHNLSSSPRGGPRFTLVPYSVRAGLLLPENDIRDNGEILSGSALARTTDRSGHDVYTLYMDPVGPRGRVYVLALRMDDASLAMVELPRLRGTKNPLLLDLRLSASGNVLTVRRRPGGSGAGRDRVVARIDLRKVAARPPRAATASRASARGPGALGSFAEVIGRSRGGRPIELREVGDLRLPMHLLVFACVRGDECGAKEIEPLQNGCPDPHAHVDVVPDLDPDHTGPHSPSHPAAGLAGRLVGRLRPEVTIWFHQHDGSRAFVRAWGRSAPAARRFAALAGLEFQLRRPSAAAMPGSQSRRSPDAAAFVVELPIGKLPQARLIRLDEALGRFGEEVGEDSPWARKG